MEIYTTWQGIGKKYANLHLALGNFDGLHLGHQYLIHKLVEEAKEQNGVPAVFTFYPHPLQVLKKDKAPKMLLRQKAKQEMLEAMGVKVLFLIPFTLEFAGFSPEKFVEKVLCEELSVHTVLVGYNYTYGKNGQGNPETLKKASIKHNFELEIIPPINIEKVAVSSTLVRGLILEGRVDLAKRYLGFYPFLSGEVVEGEKRGRVLGFPTANLCLSESLIVPPNGVYVVKVIIDGLSYWGVANVGKKPTFHGEENIANLEVHILDFKGDLYGKNIRVHFLEYLRGEKKFSKISELVEQIEEDIDKARKRSSFSVKL